MTKPLQVDIVAYAPTAFYHCTHCEIVWDQTGFSRNVRREQLESGLPEDLARDYQAVSDWVRQMFSRHGEAVLVKVIDAASIEGFLMTARHRLRTFPAVIVDGRERFSGPDFSAADQAIDRRLGDPSPA
ncbi:MAG TPA: DUF1525 domain-containing protein [Anaerolineales bacterium]|nr:DUF1525 domain-containing protein [Anaerolineales bacterium]